MRGRRRSGFTLAEITVMLIIFSLFSTTVLATLTLALRYWTQTNQRMLAEQNARVAMGAISSELRQALPDPDPGGSQPPTGYRALTPAVSPTGILAPNANSISGAALTFTEADPVAYDPAAVGWNASSPANYQRVRYYVQGAELRRERVRFTATGTVAATDDDVLVQASASGTIALSAQYLSANTVRIIVTAREGPSQFILDTTVTALGR